LKRESKEEVVWKVATSNDGDGVGWVLKKPGSLDYDLDINPEVPVTCLIYHACEDSPPRNTMNETIKTYMDIMGVDCCSSLVIAAGKFKGHEDKVNNVLAKEEVLVGARNEHAKAVRAFSEFNPAVKGVVSAISGNPTHSNRDLFPRPNKPSKKQRDRKRRRMLEEASGANSTLNFSINHERSLD